MSGPDRKRSHNPAVVTSTFTSLTAAFGNLAPGRPASGAGAGIMKDMANGLVSPVFAGREAELTQLAGAFEVAADGTPRTVLLGAEAGGGKSRLVGEFANRFTGSADLYHSAGRRPTASVNLITVHDGFTLADLVAYDVKHNEANGADNLGGTDDNRSWNCGTEGPTTDANILALRGRQSRAMLTTLMLSFGIPLLLGGDELGRTQRGNNNAYCQDNAISWIDWSAVDSELLAFTKRLVKFRRAHPVFRRRRFLAGMEASALRWFTPSGVAVKPAEWADPNARSLAIYLDGSDNPDRATDGSPLIDDDFLVLVNGWWEPLDFTLPITRARQDWYRDVDTFEPSSSQSSAKFRAGDKLRVGPRSVLVMRGPHPAA